MTATQLAQLAGMDVNYLWRIEAGRQNLSLRNVARLAKAMGITLSQLLDGVDVAEVELSSRTYTGAAGNRRAPKKAGMQPQAED
jgi:transcriptional regulator with XRE-family HTH domain